MSEPLPPPKPKTFTKEDFVKHAQSITKFMMDVVETAEKRNIEGTMDMEGFLRALYDLSTAWTAIEFRVDAVPPGGHLITGSIRLDRRAGRVQRIWNSMVAVDDSADVAAVYDKHHLVQC